MTRPRSLLLLAVLGSAWTFLGGGGEPATPVFSSHVLWAEQTLERAAREHLPTASLPALLRDATRGLVPTASPVSVEREPSLHLVVLCREPQALRTAGFEVGAVAGKVATVVVPLSRVPDLARVPGIEEVELSLPVRPLLDQSRREISLTDVQGSGRPPFPAGAPTGRGVLIGIIDSGIDIDHADFRNADGTTRVLRLWDQTDDAGPHPVGRTYGTEWLPEQIENGTCRQKDVNGHGTHVAGIAAGNGRAEPSYVYTGMAPEAELLVVNSVFTEGHLMEAVDWILRNAEGRPCVINMSLGTQFGPHDGTGQVDQFMNAVAGPGRILVAAAGNDGDARIHSQVHIPPGETITVRLSVSDYLPAAGVRNDVLSLEGWYDDDAGDVAVRIFTPSGFGIGPLSNPQRVIRDTSNGHVWLEQSVSPLNGDRKIQVDIWDEQEEYFPGPGTWRVELQNRSATSEVEVDLWIPIKFLGPPNTPDEADVGWLDYVDYDEMLSSPGTADSVITVGAYITKNEWTAVNGTWNYEPRVPVGYLAPFSSKGPTRDGRIKPDLAAPGMGIAASLSSTATNPVFTNLAYVMPGGHHVLSQGTSQACPHISGLVALMLQGHPLLSRQEAVTRLTGTARTDARTGPVPNASFGWGKVNAAAALGRLLSLSGNLESGEATLSWILGAPAPELSFQVERGPSKLAPFSPVGVALPAGSATRFLWKAPPTSSTLPWYRLRVHAPGAADEIFGPVYIAPLPTGPRLWQNSPNPFRASTDLAFDLVEAEDARLDVLDVEGRLVRVLLAGRLEPGYQPVRWDGMDGTGRPAPAGIYFVRLTTPGAILVRRMMRIQ